MKNVSLNEYKQYLEEKISSKQIEQELIENFNIQVANNKENPPKTHVLFRNAVLTVLERYVKNENIETWVKSRQENNPEAYGRFLFHTDKTTGEVRKVGIQLFVPNDIMDSKSMIIDYLQKVATHELIHAVQFANSNFKSFNPKEIRANNFKEYLSLKPEVEAWAAEAVQEVFQAAEENNFKPALIIRDAGKEKAIRRFASISESFRPYYLRFFKSQEEGDQEVWKRFLKKFVQHFKERADVNVVDPIKKAKTKANVKKQADKDLDISKDFKDLDDLENEQLKS